MSKSLVIVESPAKAKTIEKYLGKGFEVRASIGHIMDLPKNNIGVELEKRTFEPELIVSPGKEKVVDQLKKAASKADEIFLAPDPDREGEAIAYHLFLQLGTSAKEKKKIRRVTFNEITKKAVQDAFAHARDIDQNLVDAQQTRRVLDRLVGYQISPLLWDKVRRGLSAGRVQTVAVRLVVEREREIQAFKPVEYWTLEALLHPEKQNEKSFKARLVGINGERIGVDTVGAPALPGEKEAKAALAALEKAAWSVDSISKRERRQSAPAPFTTSQLQQDAARKLGFNVRRTMGVAQRLYEGIEIGAEGTTGLITYMRTDSPRVSPDAIAGARAWIGKELGSQYLPESPNVFKGKKDAQDAHEAIRPTDASRTPESIARYLSDEQVKLYTLIWRRFVASQMASAQLAVTQVNIAAKSTVDKKTYDFRVSGTTVIFDGYQKLYEASKDKKDEDDESLANKLPNLDGVKALELEKLIHEQHFTEPPPRYNEASLVKELEERGIGRPSTYASIINTIQDREYVVKHGGARGRFYPTEIGMVVCDLLVESFPYIFDTKYTARLEEELDDIEDGKEKWTTLLNGFYDHFEDELKDAGDKMRNIKRMEQVTEEKCEVCGSPLILKWGKFGSFFACSAYKKKDPTSCTFTKENTAAKPDMNTPEAQEAEESEEYCENCGRVMVLRRGPFGMFMACPGYSEDPPCKTIRKLTQKQQQKPPQPTGEDCPLCSKPLVLRQGAYGEFVSCSGYPKCKYIKQNLIEGMKCPKCGEGDIAERKARRGNIFWGCTNYPKCDFTSNYKPVPTKCPECGSPYLVEKTLKSGIFLECPNKKKGAEEEVKPKKRGKKTEAAPAEASVVCTYSKRIGDAPPPPTAETHGPVPESENNRQLQPA
ncbi:MAG TPA: type I DNA topoisomerase [Terracidiphilus sp.]|jgi:DNA topoisomerase-1|nr:type I DNA topoisomerase [Terracidiphilus sp.]